jgi:glutaredoxin
MTGRCDVHGLATSPEGACTLCVRDATRARTQRWGFTIAAVSFFGVMAVCAGAVARNIARSPRSSTPLVATVIPGTAPSASAPGASAPNASAATVPGAPVSPPAPAPEGPGDGALAKARRDVAITIYSAPWCGYCKKAKVYMKSHGIAFTERDVEDDEAAAEALRKISPKGSIPAFQIDGETMVGWSAEGLAAKIDRAAERRLKP